MKIVIYCKKSTPLLQKRRRRQIQMSASILIRDFIDQKATIKNRRRKLNCIGKTFPPVLRIPIQPSCGVVFDTPISLSYD
jgi:hypothetical protein